MMMGFKVTPKTTILKWMVDLVVTCLSKLLRNSIIICVNFIYIYIKIERERIIKKID